MNPQKSIFLDFIRISAALIVLYGHAVLIFYGDIDNNPFLVSKMRHFAVVLFFVLSGYVIGFTTKVNNRGVSQYSVARLSRLCSMVFPALIVSLIIEFFIIYFSSNNLHIESQSIVRYFITASFMNEFWLFSSAPRINGALWSVSFEFFFYLVFGVYFFTHGKVKKIIFTSLACLFAGPKILIMFPIWIAGYLAFKFNDKVFKNYLLFLFFLLMTYASYLYIKPYPFLIGFKPFYFANQFLTDNISGILFAFSIMLLPENKSILISAKFMNRFRKIADYTFPIYVLHYPILKLCKVLMNGKLYYDNQFYISIVVSLIASILLGSFFEKYRTNWSNLFKNVIEIIVQKFKIDKKMKIN